MDRELNFFLFLFEYIVMNPTMERIVNLGLSTFFRY